MKNTQVRTFLWFESDLDSALNFYKATFKEFKLVSENRFNDQLFTAEFIIHGHEFVGMNTPGGDKFNNSISISVQVDGQDEVDRLWEEFTKNGEEIQCGWVKDAWGVNWQITPFQLQDWLGHSDPEVAQYAMSQMLKMKKIVISQLHK